MHIALLSMSIRRNLQRKPKLEKTISLKLPTTHTNISKPFTYTKHLYNFLKNVTSKIKASPWYEQYQHNH